MHATAKFIYWCNLSKSKKLIKLPKSYSVGVSGVFQWSWESHIGLRSRCRGVLQEGTLVMNSELWRCFSVGAALASSWHKTAAGGEPPPKLEWVVYRGDPRSAGRVGTLRATAEVVLHGCYQPVMDVGAPQQSYTEQLSSAVLEKI